MKHPDKQALVIAMDRVERAERYALEFPHLIHVNDLRFQDLDWQYEHEGLPASKKPDSTLVPAS